VRELPVGGGGSCQHPCHLTIHDVALPIAALHVQEVGLHAGFLEALNAPPPQAALKRERHFDAHFLWRRLVHGRETIATCTAVAAVCTSVALLVPLTQALGHWTGDDG